MKTTRYNLVVLTVALCGITLSTAAQNDIVTNRLSLSARLGFNISARFKNLIVPTIGTPGVQRFTPTQPGRPNGDQYNYDDGYVLPDVAMVEYGNNDGMTGYWGYDDANSQISANTILLSRTAPFSAS